MVTVKIPSTPQRYTRILYASQPTAHTNHPNTPMLHFHLHVVEIQALLHNSPNVISLVYSDQKLTNS